MAVAFRSAGTVANGTSSIVLGTPAGVAATDVVLAVFLFNLGTGMTITPPTGWTLVNRVNSTTVYGQAVYWALGNVASYTFTITNSNTTAMGYALAYSGVDNTTPMDATGVGQANASSATVTAPTITTVTANAMLVGAFGSYDLAGGAAPTFSAFFGTERGPSGAGAGVGGSFFSASNGDRVTLDCAEAVQASAGASGTKTVTLSVAHTNAGILVALRPDAGGGTAPAIGFSRNYGGPALRVAPGPVGRFRSPLAQPLLAPDPPPPPGSASFWRQQMPRPAFGEGGPFRPWSQNPQAYVLPPDSVGVDLAGSIGGEASFAGDVALAVALAGALADAAVLRADAALAEALAGGIAGTSALSGTAGLAEALQGTLAGAAALTGDLTLVLPLQGAISGASALSGALIEAVALRGAVVGATALPGTLTVAVALAGNIAGTTALRGTASLAEALQGTVAGASALSGTLTLIEPLQGGIGGATTLSGRLSEAIALQGTVAGTTAAPGNLTLAVALVGRIGGAAALTGDLQVQAGTPLAGSIGGASAGAGRLSLAIALAGVTGGAAAFTSEVPVLPPPAPESARRTSGGRPIIRIEERTERVQVLARLVPSKAARAKADNSEATSGSWAPALPGVATARARDSGASGTGLAPVQSSVAVLTVQASGGAGVHNPPDDAPLLLAMFYPQLALAKAGKALPPIDRNRHAILHARAAIKAHVRSFLHMMALRLSAIARGRHVHKAAGADDEVKAAAAATDFDPLEQEVAPYLRAAAKDGAREGLRQVTTATDAMLSLVNERAVAWANDRAGVLIKGIASTTRERVAAITAAAVEEGRSNDTLADELQNAGAFGEARAEMIARTETAFADVQGNVIGWRESGVVAAKQWRTGEGCCDLCDELNGEEVPIDEEFDESDPPLHPNCRCDVVPVLAEDEPA